MKTFNELGIGSELFIIRKRGQLLDNKDRYGNLYHADLKSKFKIETLSNEDDFLCINKARNDSRYHLVKVPLKHRENSFYEDADNIFFTDENDYNLHIKNLIIGKIKETEQEIIDSKKSKEKYICNLREAYYDYLNNTGIKLDNPEPVILQV
jgi:hypothetical protein